MINHVGRYGFATQNVMAVCDFDMRFISVVAGWPGSAHDTRIFRDTLDKYKNTFPHPPTGIFLYTLAQLNLKMYNLLCLTYTCLM
jgi:hypothetical protein